MTTTGRAARLRPTPLPMEVIERAGEQVVTVHGRIDAHSLGPVRDLLHRVVDTSAGDVVLALEQAEIADASALGMIVGAHHRARRRGRRLVIATVSPRTGRLLRASRLDRVLLGRRAPVVPLTASLQT